MKYLDALQVIRRLRRERDAAVQQAAHWRQLYEAEVAARLMRQSEKGVGFPGTASYEDGPEPV